MDDDTFSWRPAYRYIPGHNERHAEGLFDEIKSSADGVALPQLQKTQAWNYAIAFLQEEYYWESHEVMESVWMACPPNSAEKLYVQSIIQRANAGLKRKMGRMDAAEKLELQADQLRDEAERRKPAGMFV